MADGRHTDPRRALLNDDAPPIRRDHRRLVLLGTSAIILFALLLIVVVNLDREYDLRDRRVIPDEAVTELIPPRPLGETDGLGAGFDMSRDLQPELARGGWVQIANERGELVRQYRCRRLDPNPEGYPRGWLLLEHPELEVYLSDNRVVTLTGDEAIVYAPNNLLESGTISGNVIVRMFEGGPDRTIDLQQDEPALRVTTDEANFENFMGEIHAPDWVRIESQRLELPGRDLRLLVNDRDNTVQLAIQGYDYIRITDVSDDPAVATAPQRTGFASYPAVPCRPAFEHRAGSQRSVIPAALHQQDGRSPQPRAASADDVPFYLLTLTENVRILQGDRATRRAAAGDRLEAVFSMQTQGVESGLAMHLPSLTIPSFDSLHRRRSTSTASIQQQSANRNDLDVSDHRAPQSGPLPYYQLIVSLAWANPGNVTDDEFLLGPGITLIRGDGPLSIVPLADQSRRPASADDANIDLYGSPVRLCDLPRSTEATGKILRYKTDFEEVELIGDERHPLRVDSPDTQAGGERFHLTQADGRGAFTGPGWMSRRDPATYAPVLHCGGLINPALHQSTPPARRGPARSAQDESPELHITWEEGVDLIFHEAKGGEASSRLKKAEFRGNVKVITAEVTLDAGEMTVTFPDDALDSDAIESIHARTNVRVQGVGDDGSILCNDLTLQMKQRDDGRTIPDTMLAVGQVQAIDEDQIIWADRLHVWFAELAADDDESRASADANLQPRSRRDVDVDRVRGDGNVEVLLRDGTRAFADELKGNAQDETVELLGDDVTIVSDNAIMDGGRRVILDRTRGTATSPGPGRFRSFRSSILEHERSRQLKPVVDESRNPLDMRITWQERMHYDSTHNDGAGSIDFRGAVDAESRPSPLERDTLTAHALTLDFEHVVKDNDGAQRSDAPDNDQADSRSRRLRTMIARRDARIESQIWQNIDRTDEPRIFYVAGQHVQYDTITEEALVVGDGELLIHDLTAPLGDGTEQSPFGSRGTTMMTWTRRLEMTRIIDDLYAIATDGEIELRHRNLEGTISWLTCERLEATIQRDAPGRAVKADDDADGASTGIDFGGSAQLQRVRGEGGVVIRTDRREVDCDVFDYDVTTGMAVLRAAPGRTIAITTVGAPGVLQAEQAIWNMEQDTIRITRAAVDGPR